MNWYLFQAGNIVTEFLENADKDTKNAFDQRSSILCEKGNLCREPVSKHLRNGIFEMRIRRGKDQARFLYYFDKPQRIIIVAFIALKKAQKTPAEIIDRAIRIRSEIQSRERAGNAENTSHYVN